MPFLKKGVRLLEERLGDGAEVERRQYYLFAIRITLRCGEVVKEPERCVGYSMGHPLSRHRYTIQDEEVSGLGFFIFCSQFARENFQAGYLYTIEGMNVGGYRKVEIAPHLAHGAEGIPNLIPPNALIELEIKVLR